MSDEWLFHKGEVIKFHVPPNVDLPIYVIGDSHVRVLIEAAPSIFRSSQVDIEDVYISKTAYAIGEERYLNDALNNIPEGSNVLLSFGEIDCRHYVPRFAKQNNTEIETEVSKVFEKYMNSTAALREKFRIIFMGLYICPEDHRHHENDYYDILMAKLLFHLKLRHAGWINNLPYVPLFTTSLNKGWDIERRDYPHYFNDSSHLGPCMIPVILETISKHKYE